MVDSCFCVHCSYTLEVAGIEGFLNILPIYINVLFISRDNSWLAYFVSYTYRRCIYHWDSFN